MDRKTTSIILAHATLSHFCIGDCSDAYDLLDDEDLKLTGKEIEEVIQQYKCAIEMTDLVEILSEYFETEVVKK